MTNPSASDLTTFDRRSAGQREDGGTGASTGAGRGGRPPNNDGEESNKTSDDYRSLGGIALGLYLVLLFAILVDLGARFWPPSAPTSAQRDALEVRARVHETRARADSDTVAAITRLPSAATDTAVQSWLRGRRAELAVSLERAVAARRVAEDAEQLALTAALTPANVPVFFGSATLRGVSLDVRLILLAMIIGALGSFVHVAQSYATYVGNRTLRHSWSWWYVLRPLVGGTLAVILYFAIRGALFPTSTMAGDMSPFGIAAMSALAGMFSKQAVDKLNEAFTTLLGIKSTPEVVGDADRVDKAKPPTDDPDEKPLVLERRKAPGAKDVGGARASKESSGAGASAVGALAVANASESPSATEPPNAKEGP